MSGQPTNFMVKRATGRSLSQDKKEEWMSMPTPSSRSNTPEAQARTRDPFQPLDLFHEVERTMSPPPVTFEKAMDPSLDSQPNTPTASSTFSRTSTLNSLSTVQTQDSDTTLCSQSTIQTQDTDATLCSPITTTSDDTASVSRSRTFPSMGSYSNDRKTLPKGTSLRVDLPRLLHQQHTIPPFPIGVSIPLAQYSPGRSNMYLAWRGDQGVTPVPSNQTGPSRGLTFPIEKPRNSTSLEDMQPSMFEETEEEAVSESSGLSDPLPQDINNSDTDTCDNMVKQEVFPDNTKPTSLQAETDVFVKTTMITSGQRMFGSLDSKQTGLKFQLDSSPSFLSQRHKNSHRSRPTPKTRRILASQNYQADGGRPPNPGSNVLCAASTIPTPESMEAPEHISKNKRRSQIEEIQGSRSPSPSLGKRPRGEDNRESSSQDSDDEATFLHEGCIPVNENDEDTAYDHLVESITNLVVESSCIRNVEERAVPVELYVHNLLEQIMNHTKAADKSQPFCLPIRNLPMRNSEAPGDAGDTGVRIRGQGGNAGGSSGNKRKNKAASGPGHIQDYDGDSLDDSSEEDQGNNAQKAKKLKTGKKSHNFSCPFRKRNPIRFNVRDHTSCALNPFADFALLKRHIKTSHQRTRNLISCLRCKETFADQAALKYHSTRPESCPLLTSNEDVDHEDGITEEVDRALKVRTNKDNIRSWKALWENLFPGDNLDNIPGPDHEPPVELHELLHHAHKVDSVRGFVHEQITEGKTKITKDGFQYLVEVAKHCRHERSHKPFRGRVDQDEGFMENVQTELSKRQCATQPQQTHPLPMVVCDPSHGVAPNNWDPNFVNFMSLAASNPAFFDGQFSNPVMAGYTNGFGVGASQVSAPNPGPSSEDPSQHAAPQYAPTAYPYKDMLAQNDRPCSTAEGSAGRSSGPSSQTHDSGYQTAQEQNAAALLENHQHAADPRHGNLSWDCSFSTTLCDNPSQDATIPGQDSSDLRGVFTGPFMPEGAGAGPNSEDEISPLPHP